MPHAACVSLRALPPQENNSSFAGRDPRVCFFSVSGGAGAHIEGALDDGGGGSLFAVTVGGFAGWPDHVLCY